MKPFTDSHTELSRTPTPYSKYPFFQGIMPTTRKEGIYHGNVFFTKYPRKKWVFGVGCTNRILRHVEVKPVRVHANLQFESRESFLNGEVGVAAEVTQ